MRTIVRVTLVAACVAVAGCGSSSSSPAKRTRPAAISTATPLPTSLYKATVKGRVTDASSAGPIAGALVSVDQGARTVRTDATGRYHVAFPAGPAGAITVTLKGYTSGLASGTVKPRHTATVNFKLARVVPGHAPPPPPPPIGFGTH